MLLHTEDLLDYCTENSTEPDTCCEEDGDQPDQSFKTKKL